MNTKTETNGDGEPVDVVSKDLFSSIHVIEPHSRTTGWITAEICGRWVQAKVYDEPSTFGVNGGRVSKLSIGKCATRRPYENFFDQMCYHYDRGLDFYDAPEGLVAEVVSALERLPKLF